MLGFADTTLLHRDRVILMMCGFGAPRGCSVSLNDRVVSRDEALSCVLYSSVPVL